MMVMTAKVDLKKIILILAAVAALILAGILLTGGSSGQTAATAAPNASSNEGRIQFLKSFGWEVAPSPKESGQVRIPQDPSEVFTRYNLLQKGQGYDLSSYAGKNVMRYVYEVTNAGTAGPVYATVLVHEDQVIGGDISDTSPGGKIRGFKKPETAASSPTEVTASAG